MSYVSLIHSFLRDDTSSTGSSTGSGQPKSDFSASIKKGISFTEFKQGFSSFCPQIFGIVLSFYRMSKFHSAISLPSTLKNHQIHIPKKLAKNKKPNTTLP